MKTIFTHSLKTLAVGLALAAPAHSALATGLAHTYVSGTGNDSNAGDRTTPCATFQAALANTLPGGVITALDAGDYGPVNITQAVTIDGSGTQASIVTESTTAISINAAASDTIILRGLAITNVPNGDPCNGVELDSGNMIVDGCKISGYLGPCNGIYVHHDGNTVVINTSVTGCGEGVFKDRPGAGLLSLRNVTLQGNGLGLDAEGTQTDISHSQITQNSGYGVYAYRGTLSVSGCMISGNGTGVYSDDGSVVRLINNDILNNTTGIFIIDASNGGTPGIVSSTGSNRKAGNATPGGVSPGKVIVQQ
ncbi:hypothetical protein CCAX7_20960 [Capsulimonas corticalis]|uniref:Uncharacterized protein n=1 Tax=Capsulimonas corticalis TaxID=2219043 RepID=A0A402D1X3_9BACT|nr:right-handed parallel beta-helix repeat-containing protein [Capsulimonas corticalis]BDI30045.1 hypothetical protein CCAX7_20960 [Capsulimonas corticalis]